MTDAQQFEAFMRDYQNMVFSTAMRLVANQAEAEDIAQEVFLKAYERFGDLRESPTASFASGTVILSRVAKSARILPVISS